jgi:hypothetical protein
MEQGARCEDARSREENGAVQREWAIVVETLSRRAARGLGKELTAEGLDVDVEASQARVWCFDATEGGALALRDLVLRLAEHRPEPTLQGPPMVRVWNEQHNRYVDPEAQDEDPDTREVWIDSQISPDEIRWQVRLELRSVFDFRRVRRQLPGLHRPVIASGNRHIDLGVRDLADAEATAARASALEGVAIAEPRRIRGRMRRWLLRQRLAGNYALDAHGSGPGYGFPDLGGGGGGGGDGGGGGHGGH